MKRRIILLAAGLAGLLALFGSTAPASGTPYFLLESEEQWTQALSAGQIVAADPSEWSYYMYQWDVYREEGPPYPPHEFLPAMPPDGMLYVYGGGGGGGLDPEDAGLVMLWGMTVPDGSYSSAYKYVYGLDPNLTNCTITVTVTPPGWINVVSFGIQDVAGAIRAWYWNVGAGGLPPGVPTTITINTSMVGVNAATPVATAYANNPAFDITQAQNFIFDENSNWVAGVGVPAPGSGITASWNYWHNISVMPFPGIIKWGQPPTYSDQSPYPQCYWGWDEMSIWEGPHFVADDWPCNDDRPITDIHWWGSYIGWDGPEAPPWGPQMFHIAIWTDVPVGPNDPWSHPGTLIHQWWVPRNQLFERQDGCDFYPTPPPPNPPPDTCFRYDFLIPRDQWFYQDPDSNNVYWISIAASYPAGGTQNPWGWKTRRPEWNDDAVRVFQPLMPGMGSIFTQGMPIENAEGSWDMAFVLTTNREAPMPSKVKYEQPPEPTVPDNVFLGWDQFSVWNYQTAADDWVCTSYDPVTKIRWWGSFIGWNYPYPPSLPNHFHLLIWTDVPAQPGGFSHPDQVIWEAFSYNYTWQWVGWDFNPATGLYESCFLFEQTLSPSEYFYQRDPNTILWLTVAACDYPNPPPQYPWGWKTRPRDPTSPAPDDAVAIWDPVAPTLGSVFISGEPLFWPTPEDSWDLAFELLSEPGGEPIFKYGQDPDLSFNGVDVNDTFNPGQPLPPYLLADDFPCNVTGPLTRIYVFGSWLYDYVPFGEWPTGVTFTLSIHNDLPVGDPRNPFSYSIPGDTLWLRTFQPDTFQALIYASPIEEGWLTPPDQYFFPADWTCWMYIFDIPAAEAFVQQGTPTDPIIYWLDVQAMPVDQTATFGWKSSYMHWNDDAVWANAIEPVPVPGPWNELRYPPGHQQAGQSIDLAFWLYGQSQQPPITKWSQPPEPYTPDDGFLGWNEVSVYGWYQIVADDWPCTTEFPVTDLHWWGSFLNWQYAVPPQLPDRFHIGFWSDVPPAGGNPSHPGVMLWDVWCDNFTYEFAGWDWDPRMPSEQFMNPPEACFKFTQYLNRDQWFFQDPGDNIYWISIAAVYDTGTYPEYPWGWKTRPHLFMDDAVVIYDPTAPVPGSVYVGGYPIEYPPGVSWDMAFTLTTLDCNLLADMNMDGLRNGQDIDCFTHCLITGFTNTSPTCNCACGDMNLDGQLTVPGDMQLFINALLAGP